MAHDPPVGPKDLAISHPVSFAPSTGSPPPERSNGRTERNGHELLNGTQRPATGTLEDGVAKPEAAADEPGDRRRNAERTATECGSNRSDGRIIVVDHRGWIGLETATSDPAANGPWRRRGAIGTADDPFRRY
ncbi:hypothetical protein [Natronorubrum tibetense]|uniref:Uncharacterized protein n=1 Tax=Natronorubrum tibetense GA33 TaxID=1114856 RepID=L9W8B8_9EURY|nr:hypothetical protein [Natronorubrum tibetense]ELY45765.1 hypothetical protein C496_02447 [Natronorubrum tibetense GA33]